MDKVFEVVDLGMVNTGIRELGFKTNFPITIHSGNVYLVNLNMDMSRFNIVETIPKYMSDALLIDCTVINTVTNGWCLMLSEITLDELNNNTRSNSLITTIEAGELLFSVLIGTSVNDDY